MTQEISPLAASSSTQQPEVPSELATLQIRSRPADITLTCRGNVAATLALGAIAPAATIAAGGIFHLPVWAIIVICVLQIAAAAFRRRGS